MLKSGHDSFHFHTVQAPQHVPWASCDLTATHPSEDSLPQSLPCLPVETICQLLNGIQFFPASDCLHRLIPLHGAFPTLTVAAHLRSVLFLRCHLPFLHQNCHFLTASSQNLVLSFIDVTTFCQLVHIFLPSNEMFHEERGHFCHAQFYPWCLDTCLTYCRHQFILLNKKMSEKVSQKWRCKFK